MAHIHNSQHNAKKNCSGSNEYSSLLWSPWVVRRRKIKIWIRGKKVQYSTKNGGLWLENSTNLHFQYYTELFFLEFKFWFFFARQLRVTIEDYCISLNPNNFFLVVLGVVDMCHEPDLGTNKWHFLGVILERLNWSSGLVSSLRDQFHKTLETQNFHPSGKNNVHFKYIRFVRI